MTISRRAQYSGRAVVIAAAVLPAVTALADPEPKQLRVDPNSRKLEVVIEPSKKSFKVGEPITFRVKGNQEFFLYLFSSDDGDDRGALILPNEHDSANKYPAGRWMTVPNAKVRFSADKPGVEHVTMLASTKYLDLDRSKYQKSGALSVASKEIVGASIKSLRVSAGEREGDRDGAGVEVAELTVKITGKPRPGVRIEADDEDGDRSSSSPALVVVRTDKAKYKTGESVRVAYGTDRSGAVTLLVRYPNGREEEIETFEVDKGVLYFREMLAQAPLGRQAIVARFETSKKDGADEERASAKGLRLRTSDSPQASFDFEVIK